VGNGYAPLSPKSVWIPRLMVSPRLFRRLDAGRLDSLELMCVWPAVCESLVQLERGHQSYLDAGRVVELSRACQGLVTVLNGGFDLSPKPTVLRDRPRPHRRRSGRIVYELHGQCDPNGPMEIYTRTAARAQPVAIKSLLNTLLHEWVHHFDFCRWGESVHCSGFYERLGQIYRPARDEFN